MKRIIKINICLILMLIIFITTGCQTKYLGGSRNDKWKKDLNYLQEALSRKHPNLFFKISKDEFNEEIEALKQSVDILNDDEIVNGIYEIVASVGDAHTKVNKEFSKKYPLQFYYFNDGIYLINTTDKYKEAINCKLIKINEINIESIKKTLMPLIPYENDATIKKVFPNYLHIPEILYGAKIIENKQCSKFTFENSEGKIFDLQISEVETKDNNVEFIENNYDDESYPLYMQHKNLNYWYKYLENNKTLYFKYNRCSEDEKSGDIINFSNEILELIDNNSVDKFVIDIRNNSGGSDGYLAPIIEGIKKRTINNKKKLFVIVGRETFSAAIINASQLREQTNATFIGEPTSGKPNHYGQVKRLKLPNSKISVQYSTKKIDVFKDQNNTLIPDNIIEISIDDYLDKKDPVLDFILDEDIF